MPSLRRNQKSAKIILGLLVIACVLVLCGVLLFGDTISEIVLPERVSMIAGESRELRAVTLPLLPFGDRILWESSEPETVSVDETGLIRARRGGASVITATAQVSGARASIRVDVTQQVKSITNLPEKYLTPLGGTLALDPMTDPEGGALTYQSLDPSIVQVDALGIATGVAIGETVVDIICAELTATVPIQVYIPASLAVDGVPAAVSAGESFSFHYALSPADATFQDVWAEVSGPLTLTGADTVRAAEAGQGLLSFWSEEGLLAEYEITVTGNFSWKWSKEAVKAGDWQTYPIAFTSAVKNCTGFTYSLALESGVENDISSLLAGKAFRIYILSDSGVWTPAGEITAGRANETAVAEITFPATNLRGVLCVPAMDNPGGTYRSVEFISDIRSGG